MIEMPEIWGHLWIGRTKEGFSLNKVMVGSRPLDDGTLHDVSDATIPSSWPWNQMVIGSTSSRILQFQRSWTTSSGHLTKNVDSHRTQAFFHIRSTSELSVALVAVVDPS
jgi:hypothetical protein